MAALFVNITYTQFKCQKVYLRILKLYDMTDAFYEITYVMLFFVICTITLGLFAIIIRICYLIYHLNRAALNEQSRRSKVKTLIVLGSGGHTTEMLRIVKHLSTDNYSPRIYVHADTDVLSKAKLMQFEGNNVDFKVVSIPRSRKVHQSYLTSIWSTLYATVSSIPIVWNESPELLICNGPGTCIPLCLLLFIMKVFFLSKSTIIFIESFCRVKSFSLSATILYYIADNIIVQWPYLGAPLYTKSLVV